MAQSVFTEILSLMEIAIKSLTNNRAVVAMQVVEQWHSVRAGPVQIRDGLGFFCSAYLFSLGVGGSLKDRVIEKCRVLHLLISKFLSSFTIVNFLIVLYQ